MPSGPAGELEERVVTPQQGDGRVNFVVAPNNTGAARTGTVVVRDKTVTIIQGGL